MARSQSRKPQVKSSVEVALSTRSPTALAMITRTGGHAGVHGRFGKGRTRADGRSRASVKARLRQGEY